MMSVRLQILDKQVAEDVLQVSCPNVKRKLTTEEKPHIYSGMHTRLLTSIAIGLSTDSSSIRFLRCTIRM